MNEKYLVMIDEIREANGIVEGITLSQWEEEFLDSIEDRLGDGLHLTEKQHDKLQEIWDRI